MYRYHTAAKLAGRGRSVSSALRSYRALFEPLESRQLLTATVIEVNTTADVVDDSDAFTSLREAILAANASPNDHEIYVPTGNYVLTRQGSREDAGLTGDLDIWATGSLRIVGDGSDVTTIDASGLQTATANSGDRILDVRANSTVNVSGITLTGGRVLQGSVADQHGGAIRSAGNLTAIDVLVSGNQAGRDGGGIHAGTGSALHVMTSQFADNQAGDAGGGINSDSECRVLVEGSHFLQNTANFGGGAVAGYDLQIVGGTFAHNTANTGGAIAGRFVDVTDAMISENLATGAGGGIYVVNGSLKVVGSDIVHNITSESGGGMAIGGTIATISNTSITSNQAVRGGGLYASNSAIIEIGANSKIDSNVASDSGGGSYLVSDVNLQLHDSQMLANTAGNRGGGITNFNSTIQLRQATIADNRSDSTGGGIYNRGRLRIEESQLVGNSAVSGGAIFNLGQNQGVQILGSSILGNSAGYGGGVFSTGVDTLEVDSTLISQNTSQGSGGGFFNADQASLIIRKSTISANQAAADGGGVANANGGRVHLTSVTVSGNLANGNGGGLHAASSDSEFTIEHSTIALNKADANNDTFGTGGGLFVATAAQATTQHSLYVGNLRGGEFANPPSDIVVETYAQLDPASNYNLISDPATAGGLTHGQAGNILGNGSGRTLNTYEVLTVPLANNGGPTPTHLLADSSPAINAGDPSFSAADLPLTDQRGEDFARVKNGRIDIGAIEADANPLTENGEILVGTTEDTLAIDGKWSLREAVLYANSRSGDVAIVLPEGTYRLTKMGSPEDNAITGDLDLKHSGQLRITGAGQSTIIDASGLRSSNAIEDGRHFDIHYGEVVLEGVSLVGGRARDGGAVQVRGGQVTIERSWLQNNSASGFGGAIWNEAVLRVHDSILTDNSAPEGGAITNSRGSLSISTSQLARNTATREGGAILLRSGSSTPTEIVDSVLASNTAGTSGGAILARDSGELVVRNSHFLSNRAIYGGAIHTAIIARIADSEFTRNTASYGGAINAESSSISQTHLTIENSELRENEANSSGGAIRLRNGVLGVYGSTISQNDAANAGGGIDATDDPNSAIPFQLAIADSEISFNDAARGGGMYLGFGKAHISGAKFLSNSAGNGGGAYFDGLIIPTDDPASFLEQITIDSSWFDDNRAALEGGAIATSNALLDLNNSTLSRSRANTGAAIANRAGVLHIVNSTISGNVAQRNGGGISNIDGFVDIRHSTITQNRAAMLGVGSGGGVYHAGLGTSLANTLVLNNALGASSAVQNDLAAAEGVPAVTGAYSAIGDPNSAAGLTHGVSGNIIGDGFGGLLDANTALDPNLDVNLGPTPMHKLIPGSVAIDAGDPDFQPDLPATRFDQRGPGFARESGARVDIGAYEFGSEYTPGVVGRHTFYNDSFWDGRDAAGTVFDALAIATDKTPYVPNGQTATYANVTNYTRGINGIMVDLAGSHPDVTAADFVFKVGNSNSPESWTLAPAPASVVVIPGIGNGGSDRVIITWEDGVIRNTWLEVQVLANANTGLETPDVFYWGNKVADSGTGTPAGSFVTTPADSLQVYASVTSYAAIDNVRDYDRDGRVGPSDALVVFANAGSIVRLNLPAPASPLAAIAPAGGLSQGVSARLSSAVVSGLSSTASVAAPLNAPLTATVALAGAGHSTVVAPAGIAIVTPIDARHLDAVLVALEGETDSSLVDESLLDELLAG